MEDCLVVLQKTWNQGSRTAALVAISMAGDRLLAAFQEMVVAVDHSRRDMSLVDRLHRVNPMADSTHHKAAAAAEAAVAKGGTCCNLLVDTVAWAASPWANLVGENEIVFHDEVEILRQKNQG